MLPATTTSSCMRATQALRASLPACHARPLRAPRTRTMAGTTDGPSDPPTMPDDVKEAMPDLIGTQSGTPSEKEVHHDPRPDDARAGYQAEGEDTTGDAVKEGADVGQRIVRGEDA